MILRSGKTGVVVIGRNEGARLRANFDSLAGSEAMCVYVDSGSTDLSVLEARRRNIDVVELDLSLPFTAARARNAGFKRLMMLGSNFEFVHFFDGDCEVNPDWLEKAEQFMMSRPDVGVVFGRQEEKYPRRSLYNAMIDMEWRVEAGSAKSSTGNALCRTSLFQMLGGFREDLIAGEDPEFCLRVRLCGALVWCLPLPMVLHDADVTKFWQWWRRSKRAGYAFAEGAVLHGKTAERHFVKERNSLVVWGFVVPALVFCSALLATPWSLLGLGLYPLQMLRVFLKSRWDPRESAIYSLFVVFAKFPEFAGLVEYYVRRHRKAKDMRLIEYK